MSKQSLLLLSAGLILGLGISNGLPSSSNGRLGMVGLPPRALAAQPRSGVSPKVDESVSGPKDVRPQAVPQEVRATGPSPAEKRASIQDALLRPFEMTFSKPTRLTEVCSRLSQTLGLPVVLDLAAIERLGIQPEKTVELELKGARLKTALKLLLDQAGLTYRVVPEDNLLIVTDKAGSEEPLDRVWTELHSLHRDIHDIQDALDDLTATEDLPGGEGPHVRKPTIIEEMPESNAVKPGTIPESGPGTSHESEVRPQRKSIDRPRPRL